MRLVHAAKVTADGVNSTVMALKGLTKGMMTYCIRRAMTNTRKYGSLMWGRILGGYPKPSSMFPTNPQKGWGSSLVMKYA